MTHRKDFPFKLARITDKINDNNLIINKQKSQHILGIGLTSRCNLKCPICYYQGVDSFRSNTTDLPIATLKKILAECAPLNSVNYGIEGEPFCYDKILEAFELASLYAESIAVASNGCNIHPTIIPALGEFKFSTFSLSIDTPDIKLFEELRKGASLKKFIATSEKIVDQVGQPVIFNTVISSKNIDTVYQLPKLASNLGVNAPPAKAGGFD